MADAVPSLILASASPVRAALLRGAGLTFEIRAAMVDEQEIKQAMRGEGAPSMAIADALADLKARKISTKSPEALVIGADQMLDCDGESFDKPADMPAARAQLLRLRARSHHLISAVVVARGGSSIWRHAGRVELTVRDFSEAFLDDYLATAGADILQSVGGYRLEAHGVQLFDAIRGDYFTVLGLPLLPLLAFLREHRIVQA